MNITLSIDEEIMKKVRKIAIDKNTTLTAMVRDYLTAVANSDAGLKQQRIAELNDSIQRHARDLGSRTWTRDDLYGERLDRYYR